MSDVLQPNKTSRENILEFLNTVDDEDIRRLLISQMDNILRVGAAEDNSSTQAQREQFFIAVKAVIQARLENVTS